MDTHLLIDCLLVVISIIMLWKGADWLVDSAAEIAHSLKISDLVYFMSVSLLFIKLTEVVIKNKKT